MDERTSKIANIISTKEVDTSMWKMFRFVVKERKERKKYSWWFSNNANAQLIMCAMQCATQLVNNWTVEFEFYKENFDVLYDWMKKKYEGQ